MVNCHVRHTGIGLVVILKQPFSARFVGSKCLEVPLAQIGDALDHAIAHPRIQRREQAPKRIR